MDGATNDFLMQMALRLMERLDPRLVLLVVPVSMLVKHGMDLIRRFFPKLQGNVVQSVVALVCIAAVAIQAAWTGLLAGLDPRTAPGLQLLAGLLLLAVITWFGAMGYHSATQNRNRPVEPAEPVEEAVSGAEQRLRDYVESVEALANGAGPKATPRNERGQFTKKEQTRDE